MERCRTCQGCLQQGKKIVITCNKQLQDFRPDKLQTNVGHTYHQIKHINLEELLGRTKASTSPLNRYEQYACHRLQILCPTEGILVFSPLGIKSSPPVEKP